MSKDYYKTLGVKKDASKEEIKKAYKQLAKKFHPDINKEADAEAKFKEINEAVSILADDEKRQQYDQFGTTDFQAGGGFGGAGFSDFMRGFDFGSFDFDNIFEMFFGGGGRRRSRSSRGADLQYDLEIDLKEAATGIKKEIPLNKLENCEECDGQGGELEECEECSGSGVTRKTARTPFGMFQTQSACRKCSGRGSQIKKACRKCSGEGRIRVKKKISVNIPAGVDTGTRIRLRGEGVAGENGGGSGDLYVMIYVKPNEVFKRDGDDIYLNVPISFTQAALGDEIEVPTLDGKAKLKIPAGTQSHTLFRMKDKGMPNLEGYGTGDQMVRVEIKVPEKLDKKQKELISELAKLEKEKPSKSFLKMIFG